MPPPQVQQPQQDPSPNNSDGGSDGDGQSPMSDSSLANSAQGQTVLAPDSDEEVDD